MQSQPQKWMDAKCKIEANVYALLSFWMGGSCPQFTDTVFGVSIKIRRSRVVVQLWHTQPFTKQAEGVNNLK